MKRLLIRIAWCAVILCALSKPSLGQLIGEYTSEKGVDKEPVIAFTVYTSQATTTITTHEQVIDIEDVVSSEKKCVTKVFGYVSKDKGYNLAWRNVDNNNKEGSNYPFEGKTYWGEQSGIKAERMYDFLPSGGKEVELTLEWKACWTGTVYVTVYQEIDDINFWGQCYHNRTTPMVTYKINRVNKLLSGSFLAEDSYIYNTPASGSSAEQQVDVRFKSTAGDASSVKEIKLYVDGVHKMTAKKTDISRSGRSTVTAAGIQQINYRFESTLRFPLMATGLGKIELSSTIISKCGEEYPGPSKTIDMQPSCVSYPNVSWKISGKDVVEHPDGVELQPGESYTIDLRNVTEEVFQDHYKLSLDKGDDDAIVLQGRTITVDNNLVGRYTLSFVLAEGRAGYCTELPSVQLFVGGSNKTVEFACPIFIEKGDERTDAMLAEIGFEKTEDQGYLLEHFAATVVSDRAVVIGPGVVLTQGAELLANESALVYASDATDLDKNYITQTSYDEYGRKLSESRSYFNSKGDATQAQVKDFSKGVILASETLYDAYGRAVINTLPAPVQVSTQESQVSDCGESTFLDLAFHHKSNFVKAKASKAYDHTHFDLDIVGGTAVSKEESPDAVYKGEVGTLGWYYSNNNGSASGSSSTFINARFNEENVATTHYPYSRTLYQRDGTGQVRGTTQPGDVFRAGSGRMAEGTTLSIRTDDAYLADYLLVRAALGYSSPTPASWSAHFFRSQSRDVNGRVSESYLDKGGHSIMSLYFGERDAATGTPISRSYQFYNDLGQLVCTVSPNGVAALLEGNNIHDATVEKTTYQYDVKGRLVQMTEPDAGTTRYLYRKDGSIRFSQNAKQREESKLSYTHYDRSARPVASGEFVGHEAGLFESLSSNEAVLESIAPDGGLTAVMGRVSEQVMTRYDGLNPGVPNGYRARFLRGKVSYTEKQNVSKTWYSYDELGRVAWMVQDIAGLGIKTVAYQYGKTGAVQVVAYQKDSPSEAFFHYYTYDLNGRLEKVYTAREEPGFDIFGYLENPSVLQLQASYSYYLHGPLKQVSLAAGLQQLDYYYTVQGWLKAINNPNEADPDNKDVFSMQLDYFSGDYASAGSGIVSNAVANEDFSGNIQQQQWRTLTPAIANLPGNQVANAYQYQYDERYQLQSAVFGSMSNSSFIADAQQAYSTTGLDYDLNGNILGLQRRGQSGTLLHDFTGKYNYTTGTNQLNSVAGYKSYTYNALGQMTEEIGTEGSQKLTYDVSGKVTEVRDENDALIAQYQYDDRGYRVSKQSYENGALVKTTYYVRDASGSLMSTYEQEANQTIAQTEVPIYGSSRVGLYQAVDQRTEYYLTDHLGNTRAIVNRERLSNGGVDVSYFADYFAYGSIMRSAGSKPKFGYQGEYAEDETSETGFVSFELRDWDPVIGRWLAPDPMGQYASPYLGMGNSPVNRIDPDGGFDEWNIINGERQWVSNKGGDNIDYFNYYSTEVFGENSFDYYTHTTAVAKSFVGLAELGGMVKDFYFGATIETDRFMFTDQSTISSYTIDGSNSGYFLEPRMGTPTEAQTEGSNTAITAGTYHLNPHNTSNYSNVFRLVGVPGRTAVLIHAGNYPADTRACLLPGCNIGPDYVGPSGPQLNEIRGLLNGNSYGSRIIIRNPIPYR